MDSVDCVVVGAGVIGLAVARELALRGREVIVLEAATAIGTGTSSRNSEVVHAGIYYPEGSLKAVLCVAGRDLLYAYCRERHIGCRPCGKLIVATSTAQLAQLEGIRQDAIRNGVTNLQRLSGQEVAAMEPVLSCIAALYSPSSGIVDSHALMLSLRADLESAGGMLAFASALANARCVPGAIVLETADGTQLRARTVVNSAGLAAPALARRFSGLSPQHVPQAYFAKGSYFGLVGRSPCQRLVYPVPEAAGLGVHLTVDLAGQARFGPDVQWVESADDLSVDGSRADAFYAEIRKYWPGLADGALQPAYAGIRPKIQAPGEPARDFLIQGPGQHGVAGLVNLFGIESPGLTSALALAAYVADRCEV
ncbi:MAG: NAD(P)/FAD-dependent oxidoreductase [Rhodoferax sp.]|nr:NAD(P)/FAD-dependent oxidoreductase [Rhodoferax sp.]